MCGMEAGVLMKRNEKVVYANLINKIKQLEGITHMIAHNLRGAGSNIAFAIQFPCHQDHKCV